MKGRMPEHAEIVDVLSEVTKLHILHGEEPESSFENEAALILAHISNIGLGQQLSEYIKDNFLLNNFVASEIVAKLQRIQSEPYVSKFQTYVEDILFELTPLASTKLHVDYARRIVRVLQCSGLGYNMWQLLEDTFQFSGVQATNIVGAITEKLAACAECYCEYFTVTGERVRSLLAEELSSYDDSERSNDFCMSCKLQVLNGGS